MALDRAQLQITNLNSKNNNLFEKDFLKALYQASNPWDKFQKKDITQEIYKINNVEIQTLKGNNLFKDYITTINFKVGSLINKYLSNTPPLLTYPRAPSTKTPRFYVLLFSDEIETYLNKNFSDLVPLYHNAKKVSGIKRINNQLIPDQACANKKVKLHEAFVPLLANNPNRLKYSNETELFEKGQELLIDLQERTRRALDEMDVKYATDLAKFIGVISDALNNKDIKQLSVNIQIGKLLYQKDQPELHQDTITLK